MIPNKEYLLTICIPTYNRGDLLKETLESIVQQATEDIEIVILDSGSTDNTSEVVKHYQRTNTRIKYHYNNVKRGIDVDMSATVEFANGEYCWLLSDDDPLVDNALETVKEALNSKCEIYLCNRIMCDASLNPIKNKSWLKKMNKNIFQLSRREDLIFYLDNCIEFGAIFSYMSAIIFKNSAWKKTVYDDRFTGSGYAHVTRVFDIINNNGKLHYIVPSLILNRSFNDSFMEMGIVKRFMLDIDGYMKLADRCLPNDMTLRKKFLKVMTLEHPWYQIIKLKSFVENPQEWKVIKSKLLYCGYSKTVLFISSLLAKHKKTVLFAVNLNHRYNTAKFHSYFYGMKKHSKIV
jgi:abequosyltransferase